MGLIDEFMSECVLIDKTTESDGYGGVITTYVDGASFNAAIVFDTSLQARVAAKEGVTSLYTVTTPRNVVLEYHQIFRRVKDGKIFRVTSDGDDRFTPKSATLDMRQCNAEEWSLPNG